MRLARFLDCEGVRTFVEVGLVEVVGSWNVHIIETGDLAMPHVSMLTRERGRGSLHCDGLESAGGA